jgi:hypothetical protein
VSPLKIKIPSKNVRVKPTNTPIIHSVYEWCMVAPTRFGITLPFSGSVPSAFWETLNWEVDGILWMCVLCLVTCAAGLRHMGPTGLKPALTAVTNIWDTSSVLLCFVMSVMSGPNRRRSLCLLNKHEASAARLVCSATACQTSHGANAVTRILRFVVPV